MNHNQSKPQEILELEKIYNIELRNIGYNNKKKLIRPEFKNHFVCNKQNRVIALNLSDNNFAEIIGLEKFNNLTDLYLYSNRITEIKGLEKLSNLKKLNLHSNLIIEIKSLEKLSNLEILYLSKNQIKEIKGLENLSKLKELILFNNQIEEIKGLEKLSNLEYLSFYSNRITEIKGLEKFTILKGLYLSSNKITEIKGLEKLNNLIELSLSDNQIIEIQGLKNLSNLTNLDLGENQIEEIKGLDNNSKLISLKLEANNITKIENLEHLVTLKELDLGNNKIKEIEGLETLTHLEELNLNKNKVIDISGLRRLNLKVFKSINISYNHFKNDIINFEGKNIFNQIDSILHYFHIQDENTGKRFKIVQYPLKIMLLGNHGAGKSSYYNYFASLEELVENKVGSTHLLRVMKYTEYFEENDKKKGKTEIENSSKVIGPDAMFYDFGGQDYYHGVYQAFMSKNALSLLFWHKGTNHNRQSNDSQFKLNTFFNLEYWLAQHRFYNKCESEEDIDINKPKEDLYDPLWLIQTYADQCPEDFSHYNAIQKRF